MVNFSKPNFRQIQSSCVKFDEEEVKYEKGKLTPAEKKDKPSEIFFGTAFQYEKWDTSIHGFKSAAKRLKQKFERMEQVYDPKRVEALGPDLAAAHYFTFRGGIVRFIGDNLIFDRKGYSRLPTRMDKSFLLEAISLPNFNLYYEGLDHLKDLHYLKAISFRGVEKFDNWYLDRVSHLVPTLEYLDIGFCKKVDFNVLHCLYRLKNLKCLNVEGISDSLEFKLGCLTLESEKRDLVVVGLLPKHVAKSAFDVD